MADFPEPARLVDLVRKVKRDRGFGDFWSHMLVAEGACEVGLDPVVSVWDIAASPGDRRRSRRKVHGFRRGERVSTVAVLCRATAWSMTT